MTLMGVKIKSVYPREKIKSNKNIIIRKINKLRRKNDDLGCSEGEKEYKKVP